MLRRQVGVDFSQFCDFCILVLPAHAGPLFKALGLFRIELLAVIRDWYRQCFNINTGDFAVSAQELPERGGSPG